MIPLKTKIKNVYYTLNNYRIATRKSRKEKYCSNCNLHIHKGEFEKEISGYDGLLQTWFTFYICERCISNE